VSVSQPIAVADPGGETARTTHTADATPLQERPPPQLSCIDRQEWAQGYELTAYCATGETLMSGGGGCDVGSMRATRPQSGGWQITCANRIHVA
jgi:hypothetical protein